MKNLIQVRPLPWAHLSGRPPSRRHWSDHEEQQQDEYDEDRPKTKDEAASKLCARRFIENPVRRQ